MVAASTATDKDSASVLVEDRIVDNILIAGVAVDPKTGVAKDEVVLNLPLLFE